MKINSISNFKFELKKKIHVRYSSELSDTPLPSHQNTSLIFSTRQRSMLYFLKCFKIDEIKEAYLFSKSIDERNIKFLDEDLKLKKYKLFIREKEYKDLEKKNALNNNIINADNIHLKMMIIKYKAMYYIIQGSGNFTTGGAKIEQYLFFRNNKFATNFLKSIKL